MSDHSDDNGIMGGEAAAIIEAARGVREPRVLDLNEAREHGDFAAPVLILPEAGGGSSFEDVRAMIDVYRPHPERREGIARLTDFASFIAHANRFRDEGSAIFINDSVATPRLTSILDYHEPLHSLAQSIEAPAQLTEGAPSAAARVVMLDDFKPAPVAMPRFGRHRGEYAPAFSDQWKHWIDGTKGTLSRAEFSELIEGGAAEILDVDDLGRVGVNGNDLGALPAWFARRMFRGRKLSEVFASADAMLDISQGLTITESSEVGEIERRDGGVAACSFVSERKGKTSIDVPPAIAISLPVFRGGDPWQLPARINVAAKGEGSSRRLEWRIKFYGVAETVRAVIAEMRERAHVETGLPVFAGSPE